MLQGQREILSVMSPGTNGYCLPLHDLPTSILVTSLLLLRPLPERFAPATKAHPMSEPVQNDSSVADAIRDNTSAVECPECTEGDKIRWLLEKLQRATNSTGPVLLQAANVRRISTLALQVISAAQATALRHRQPFSIPTPSPEFKRACADTGLRSLLSPGD